MIPRKAVYLLVGTCYVSSIGITSNAFAPAGGVTVDHECFKTSSIPLVLIPSSLRAEISTTSVISGNILRTSVRTHEDDVPGTNQVRVVISSSLAGNNIHSTLSLREKVVNGAIVAPSMIIAPLYAIGFGIVGHKKMWVFSKWIYGKAKPNERYVNDHFDRMQRFLISGTALAKKKSREYKIHPFFAGLSLISTSVLAFFTSPSKINAIIPHRWLLVANTCICFVSALSARGLRKTMLGNDDAKKWNAIQGNLSMIFSALAFSPGFLSNIVIHLNWSLLFANGVLERFYVLCIMSQLKITTDRKTFLKYYSPQFKAATLASIPLGMVTFYYDFFFGGGFH